MKPAAYPLTLFRGSSFRLQLVYKDDAGAPYNLSGWGATLSVRSITEENEILRLTEVDGIVLGADGSILATRSAAQMASIPEAPGSYALELREPNGDEVTVLIGPISVQRGVS